MGGVIEYGEFVFPNGHHVDWTIMIVLYPYVTGLVAGAFVVSALYHVFRKEALKPVARLALVASFCFCAFATMPLLLHLHHPERAFNIMFMPNFQSAMAGFGFIYSFYMLLLIVEIWLVFREDIVERANTEKSVVMRMVYKCLALGVTDIPAGAKRLDAKLMHFLAVLGIPAACVLHGYVGFIFGGIKANPWWSTALMPVIFLVSAIVSGIAALIIIYVVISYFRSVVPDAECVRAMMRTLWLFLLLAFSLEELQLMNMAYESGQQWDVISTLINDHLAVSYGLVQVLLGSIIPLLFLWPTSSPKVPPGIMAKVGVGLSFLVLIQVLAMRWNVVIGGQLFSKSFRGFVDYVPEWGGREGLWAGLVILVLPFVVLWMASKLLPLWKEHEHAPT